MVSGAGAIIKSMPRAGQGGCRSDVPGEPAIDAGDVVRLLEGADKGAPLAADTLLPIVYDQLKRIAQQRMSEQRRDHTLQATALVHEAYVRLVGERDIEWRSRAHFVFAAARAMRDILVEHARARGRLKRGGDGLGRAAPRVALNVADLAAEADPAEILALEDAVRRLESMEPDVAAVVHLRFFAGLTGDQVAQAMGISARQVDRHWAYARAWLFREIRAGDEAGAG